MYTIKYNKTKSKRCNGSDPLHFTLNIENPIPSGRLFLCDECHISLVKFPLVRKLEKIK
jgi:hypothetical protein